VEVVLTAFWVSNTCFMPWHFACCCSNVSSTRPHPLRRNVSDHKTSHRGQVAGVEGARRV